MAVNTKPETDSTYSVNNEIYRVMKPTLYFARLYALAPFSLKTRKISYNYLPISAICLFILIKGVTDVFISFYNNPIIPKFEKLMLYLQVCATSSVSVLSWIANHFRYKRLFMIFDSITEIETMIKSLEIQINHDKYKTVQYIVIPSILFVGINNFIDNVFLDENMYGLFLLYTLAMITLSHFLQLISIIRYYFRQLNLQLCKLGKLREDGVTDLIRLKEKYYRTESGLNSVAVGITAVNILPRRQQKTFSAITENEINAATAGHVNDAVKQLENRQKIRTIREIHRLVCNLSTNVNRYFALQILMNITANIINVTSICYYVPALVIDQSDKPHHYLFISIKSVLFIAIFAFLQLWTMAHVCSTASDTGKFTGVLVHGLMNMEECHNLREDLETFSKQLLHQKVQFTACDFFTLDFALINAVIGVVITYIVILIQFQMSN